MDIQNIVKQIKELKAKIIKENGNKIILELSTKDLLLYLVTKDAEQDEEIKKLKQKTDMACAILVGVTITLIASLFIEKIL